MAFMGLGESLRFNLSSPNELTLVIFLVFVHFLCLFSLLVQLGLSLLVLISESGSDLFCFF